MVEQITEAIRKEMTLPQLKFVSNFHRFRQAVDVGPCAGKRLGDVFEQFEEAGCFSLKVVYGLNKQKIRVDYGLTLSCLNIVNEKAANSTRSR